MMRTLDFFNTLLLITLTIGVSAAYIVRVRLRGRAHFERVDKQVGSPLLSRELMEMAYWSLQPLGRLFVFLKVSPNVLSWTSLGFGLISAVSLAHGQFGSGAVFATISAFLDSLDGLVARLTGVSSDAGEVLDASIDRYVEFFFLGALVIYYREIAFLQILCLLALLGSFMVSYSTAKAEALQTQAPAGIMRRPERAFYLILGAALSPISIRYIEAFNPLSIGYPMVAAVAFVALLANIAAIERLWATARAMRRREQQPKNEAPSDEKTWIGSPDPVQIR